jgi:hypothetical protein
VQENHKIAFNTQAVGAHPLCPERVPERMNSAPTSSARGLASYKSTRERMNYAPTQSNHNPSARGWPPTNAPCRRPPFMPGTGARAKHRADSLQHTSCRSSPRERMNYARNHNPSARGLASYKCTRRSSPFMLGTGARANELSSNPTTTLRPEG